MTAFENPLLNVLGQEVELSTLDKALKQLWADEKTRCRASLLNFAIYSESPNSVERNTHLLNEITKQHACRGILIIADPEAARERLVRSFITVHCQIGEGKRSVCSEQVSLLLSGASNLQIANLILSHLESDLPLFFWWQGDLTANFTDTLYREIDRLFIDSSTWTDAVQGFKSIGSAMKANHASFRVYDLSWLRSHMFRTALAASFSDPASLACLPLIEYIELHHSKKGIISALLMTAWIAARLKGELEVNGKSISIHREGASTIQVNLKETEGLGCVHHLKLVAPDRTFEIARHDGSNYIQFLVKSADYVRDELLPADHPTDSRLIIDQLSRLGGNSLYASMYPLMDKLLEYLK